MEPSDRPTKRPRLKGPDGFHVTKARSKSTYKPPPPSFVSSFGAPKPSTGYLNNEPEKPKSIAHHARSHWECPQNLVSKLSDTAASLQVGYETKGKKKALLDNPADHRERPSEPSTSANPERLHESTVKHPNISPSSSTSVYPPALLRQKPLSAPLRTVMPPLFVVSASAKASTSAKPLSFSILKPPPLPQLPTKTVILKPLAPPTIEPSFLKKPSTNMKAISSFATDPTKDGAGAELLSLFLQQHRHSFVSPFEREMQRGIGLSPRKNKSVKGKFRRGGLAERAQHLISCSKTDHTLWHRQLEQTLPSSSLSSSLPSYDMRFRILRVLPLPAKTPTPTGVHLAVCRVSSRHKLSRIGELTDQCYVILFPHLSGPSREFEEGKDVLAWKPWFKSILTSVVPREILETLYVEPLMPPRSVIMVPRWHIMRAD